jgi:hypothetical protein
MLFFPLVYACEYVIYRTCATKNSLLLLLLYSHTGGGFWVSIVFGLGGGRCIFTRINVVAVWGFEFEF